MAACLGLGRSQRDLNKQQLKDITQLQQQKQQTQATITNQNYYTTQQQPQNQRHLVARGLTTNVGALKPELQQQQQQHNEESHLLRQEQQNNVQHNATPCTTTPQYRNTTAATTTANIQQLSLSTKNDRRRGVGSATHQQPQPLTISFQKNTVTVEVTPTLPSTVSSANPPGIVTNANVKTFRKINRQTQQQQEQQEFQQKHQHQHLLHQQQQQQLESDLDAIEVCVDPEPHVSFKGCGGGMLRQAKTLGRLNHQHQHHHSIEGQHGQCTNMSQITSLQLLQLQQHQQSDYSYAYYEPGAVMKHTNIPHAEPMSAANEEEDLIPPKPNSIRALLLKGKKNKLLVSPTTRESYQTRLTQQQNHSAAGATASANCSYISTTENFYEEISASSTSSSSKSITNPHQRRATCHSSGALNRTLVEEELRRVENRHHKTLGELNLSVEAMLMPECPPNSSPTDKELPSPAVSFTKASGQPLRLTSSSTNNICDTALLGGPADDFVSPIPNSATESAGVLQSSCLAADLDSGSSGASYIGSLRLHKTNALKSSRSNNLSTARTAASGDNAAAKSQQSAFAYATQNCRSFQRAKSNNANASATTTSASASSSNAVLGTTSPRSIKHLLQIHQNTKQQQQQLRHHQQQQHQQSQCINDDFQKSSGYFTRASCGCRILNCAKIRAAEDPSPVVLNAQPNVSKAHSFWNRKGWCKLPGFSTSSSSIHDAG